MKEIKLFYLDGCPYCRQAFDVLAELKETEPAYREIPIRMYEEYRDAEVVAQHDYYYAPTMFIGGEKLYEAHPGESREECCAQVKKVLDAALRS